MEIKPLKDTNQKKPSSASVEKTGDGEKKSRYEGKILYYLKKIMKPKTITRKRNKSNSKEPITNDLCKRYKNERKKKMKQHRYKQLSKNKPVLKTLHIVNASINYGLQRGILSQQGKYYYFTNTKSVVFTPDVKQLSTRSSIKHKTEKNNPLTIPKQSKEKNNEDTKNNKLRNEKINLLNVVDRNAVKLNICKKETAKNKSKLKKETNKYLPKKEINTISSEE